MQASRAHINKNLAELELARIEQDEAKQRREFHSEYQDVQREIRNIRKFKEFLKQRQGEYDRLQHVQREILHKRDLIAEKEKVNRKILAELHHTQLREKAVTAAFAQIRAATGAKDSEELLALFLELQEKARTLQVFGSELHADIAGLDARIAQKETQAKLFEWRSRPANPSRRRGPPEEHHQARLAPPTRQPSRHAERARHSAAPLLRAAGPGG